MLPQAYDNNVIGHADVTVSRVSVIGDGTHVEQHNMQLIEF